MRRVFSFIFRGLLGVVALVGVLGALLGYFVYSPAPEVPQLSGTPTRGTMTVGDLQRTYRTYVPRGLAKGAPLVVVMHGAGENGERMRIETGYGFEILADQHGFAVVYPNAYEGYWDGCTVAGDVSANGLNIDDVGFLTGMADKLVRIRPPAIGAEATAKRRSFMFPLPHFFFALGSRAFRWRTHLRAICWNRLLCHVLL